MRRMVLMAAALMVCAEACRRADSDTPPSLDPNNQGTVPLLGGGTGNAGRGGAGGSGGATAVSASSSTTSGVFADCSAVPSCLACRDCASAGPCRALVEGCRLNPRCHDALNCVAQCFTACGTDSACATLCQESCRTSGFNEDAFTDATAVLQCVCQTVCDPACQADQFAECQRGFLF